MSKLKSQLVSEKILAELCEQLSLHENLRLSKGARKEELRAKASVRADLLEAVLAAVFLDGGWRELQKLSDRLFTPYLDGVTYTQGVYSLENVFDYKSHLQELFSESVFAGALNIN